MAKLKVYGVTTFVRGIGGAHDQARAVVAAASQKAAAELLAMPLSEFRRFGGETGNAEQIRRALAEPGVVWAQRLQGHEWFRLEKASSRTLQVSSS